MARDCDRPTAGHIKSDNAPVLVELRRHLPYCAQVGEALAALRQLELKGDDEATGHFGHLLQMAREESRLVADLSTKLRFH